MCESLGFVKWKQPSQTVSWLEHEKTPSHSLMLRLTRADSQLQTGHSACWTKHSSGSKMENTCDWPKRQLIFIFFFRKWDKRRGLHVTSSCDRDRRKLRFFCATVVISGLLITIQRTEIHASMRVISGDLFQLQDMSLAQVIECHCRILTGYDEKKVFNHTVHRPIKGN